MERYHIFKLGLAIVFYATYCIRPMMMDELQINSRTDTIDNKTKYFLDEDYVYYQGVQGKPGVDFPVLSHIPRTSFSCKNIESGYYADLETDCQVFHICEEGKKISFLCPNGTIFQQSELICEWWFKVDCINSPNLYEESAEQLRENNARRKASRRVKSNQDNHGAVMRTEEHATITASQKGKNFEIVGTQQGNNHRNSNKNYYKVENGNNKNSIGVDNRNYNSNLGRNVDSQRRKPEKTRTELSQVQENVANVLIKTKTGAAVRNSGDKHEKADEGAQYVNIRVNGKTVDQANQFVNIRGSENINVKPVNRPVQKTSNNANTNQNIRLKVSAGLGINTKQTIVATKSNSLQNNNRDGKEIRLTNKLNTFDSNVTIINKNNKVKQPDNNENVFNTNSKSEEIQISNKDLNKEVNESKQKSTVSLTLNDITNKRIEPSDSDESQITQETGSFYKNSFNSIQQSYKPNQHANHRETYSELKEPQHYTTKILSAISSVTPQYITTQPIYNGRPFIGSQVGTTIKESSNITTPSTLFNIGQNHNTLPPVTETTTVTYPVPEELFNVGRTDKAIVPLPLSTLGPNSIALDLEAPAIQSLNLGQQLSTEKIVTETTTKRVIDHATVYGKYIQTPSTTTAKPVTTYRRPFVEINNEGISNNLNSISTTIKVLHSKTSDITTTPTLFPESKQNSGFYVTKESTATPRNSFASTNSFDTFKFDKSVQKPRPFRLSTSGSSYLPGSTTKSSFSTTSTTTRTPIPTHPTYKISSASPFSVSLVPTEPTPYTADNKLPSTFENVDSMINALAEMANSHEDYADQTPRPGLVIPPSAGPQTLHTLAVYFANALNGISSDKLEQPQEDNDEQLSHVEVEKKRLTALLTQMTMDRYNELFSNKEEQTTETSTVSNRQEDDNDLETQHSKNPAQSETPKVRQLAKVFTQALSSYLDDPATFRKVLAEVRPTEPPPLETEETPSEAEDELLNFSDADAKSSYPPIFPTPRPTWGYLLAYNGSQNLDVKNSITNEQENLQLADSQSFIPRFNQVTVKEEKEKVTFKSSTEGSTLPNNHWTSSPGVAKLWKSTFAFDPASLNNGFGTTEATIFSSEDDTEIPNPLSSLSPPVIQPHHEIKYELRALPKIALNSTQVHGILIDFMNTTKYEESNKLQRILRKLNTTEDEFLAKMKEIESNPLTKRLILLLISECGNNVTKEIEAQAVPIHTLINRNIKQNNNNSGDEILETQSSIGGASARQNVQNPTVATQKSSSNLQQILDVSLNDNAEDTRALQLLNSLYTIASKFGKK